MAKLWSTDCSGNQRSVGRYRRGIDFFDESGFTKFVLSLSKGKARHIALVMLGALFLVKQKKAGHQQWAMLSFTDLVTAREHLLPRRQLTAEDLADIINKLHYLRQKTKESHARRPQVVRE